MGKKLEEMSFEELGELFPIILSKHKPEWKELYQKEEEFLKKVIGTSNIVRINHIGSTSVPGLDAKPTIDILLEIAQDTDLNRLIKALKDNGYRYSPQPDNPPPNMMFMKGYTEHGFEGQAYHLHVRYFGDWNELYFRDYLMLHENTAKEYAVLKHELKTKLEHDREAYTGGKTEFIRRITDKAKEEFGGRYACTL